VLQYLFRMMRALRTLSAIVLYVSIAAASSPQSSKDINTSSTGVNVSLTQSNDVEIQRLTGEVGKARTKSDSWDTATNLVLLAGALVGIGIAIVTIGSSRAKSGLINLQDDLATKKEAQLSLLLSANERETARLKELAARADAEAGKANRAAGEANDHAAQLESKAEELRKQNLVLESELSPRLFTDQGAAVEKLRAFGGSQVQLAYLLDPEAKRTAEQINWVLDAAGWVVIPKPASTAEAERVDTEIDFFDGVIVSLGGVRDDENLASRRTNALLEELNKDGIKAFRDPRINMTRIVEIRVGLKPSPALTRLAEEHGLQTGPGMAYSAGRRRALPSIVQQ
jgi:hypothetical protein